MHPATAAPIEQLYAQELLNHFRSDHLPENLQVVSRSCSELAQAMASTLPSSAELTAGLRKLLEAKDCFVRAAMEPAEGLEPPGSSQTPDLAAFQRGQAPLENSR